MGKHSLHAAKQAQMVRMKGVVARPPEPSCPLVPWIGYPGLFLDCNNFVYSDSIGETLTGYNGQKNTLTTIVIPSTVKHIDTSAFYGCSSLTSLTIPRSVISIGNNAFYIDSGQTEGVLTQAGVRNSSSVDVFADMSTYFGKLLPPQ